MLIQDAFIRALELCYLWTGPLQIYPDKIADGSLLVGLRMYVVKLYIGNLAFSTTQADLEQAFAQFGEVSDATIINDRETGRSRGFGFVDIPDDASAREAISKMDGTDLGGREIKVNEAKPRR